MEAAAETLRPSSSGSAERLETRGEGISQAGERRSTRIESLRALAALAVLWGHVTAASLDLNQAIPVVAQLNTFERLVYGGGLGVFFFFALTGYLLFWPFAKRDFSESGPIDLGRYAANRALRILPLYYAVVIAVLLFQEQPLGIWAQYLTFSENYFPETAGKIVGPAWSLVVELHFYVLLPLLAWAIARVANGARRRAAMALLALGLISLAVRIVTVYNPEIPSIVWRLNLPATFLFFIPGMLLALLRLSWEEQRPTWLRGAVTHSDLWILASLPLWAVVIFYRYHFDAALGVAAFLMIGACVLPLQPGPLTRALQWRPLAIVGIASYSLYLWHVPVIETSLDIGVPDGFVALALTAIPAAIVVALLSYRLIEAPFLRLRGQWSRSAATQVAKR